MYQSPFGNVSSFYDTPYKEKLRRFLLSENIVEFVYSNTSTIDAIPVVLRIFGAFDGDALFTTVSSICKNALYPNFNIGADYVSQVSELQSLKNEKQFLAYKFKDGKWKICEQSVNQTFATLFAGPLLIHPIRTLNDNEYQQIYDAFLKCKTGYNTQEQRRKFNEFCQKINQRLSKKFYGDVDLAAYVKLVDDKGKTIFENTLKTDYKKKVNDLKLNITLRLDGKIKISHEISKNYLKEYENKWINEAKKRGLEVNVAEMRYDIIGFLESQKAEQSFARQFLQNVKSWYDGNVGSYIEAFQATQKITKNIWKEGVINESTWYSKNKEHKDWPGYMQFHPVIGGVADGVIDEVVGIPMACKSVYELATEDEKRKALVKIFSSEGFGQMIDGLKEQVKDIANDGEKRGHFGGQTAVSVISMLGGGGFINKAGELDEMAEMAENVAKHVDEMPNPAKTSTFLDKVKKAERTVVNEKALKEFVDEVGEEFIESSAEEAADIAASEGKKLSLDTWKKLRERGQKFNQKVRDLVPEKYDHFEVIVEHPTLKYTYGKDIGKPRRFVLDSYNDGLDIVSRKATDFNKIQLNTFEGYCKELLRKYPIGAKIVAKDAKINGKLLAGKLKIEVPKINEISNRLKEFKDIAKKYQIEIVFEAE